MLALETDGARGDSLKGLGVAHSDAQHTSNNGPGSDLEP
jgi:hypothetical protein